MPPSPRYSQAAVQDILSRALQARTAGEFSRTQLEEMAAELSIDPADLDQAERQWRQAQAAAQARQRRRDRQRRDWLIYGISSVGFVAIDLATAGTLTWAFFPIVGWGLGLLLGGKSCHRDRSLRSVPPLPGEAPSAPASAGDYP